MNVSQPYRVTVLVSYCVGKSHYGNTHSNPMNKYR
jgi:hypothetical protein